MSSSTIIHHPKLNFQDIKTPDINLERDLIEPEVLFGMETAKLSKNKKFHINISTILISALIFLVILAWFDFVQATFYEWADPRTQIDNLPSHVKLWYAILITTIVIILIILIYYHHSYDFN